MVICVLLKDAATGTTPCGMMRRSRFFLNSFLRLVAAAGLPPGVASGAAFFCCSFATCFSVSLGLTLLTDNFLLGRNRAAPRAFAGTGVGVRALATYRQVATVTDSPVGLNFDQPADVHLNLLAEIAFHAAFLFNLLAQSVGLILGKVADLFVVIDARLMRELPGALLPDAVDRG